MQLYRRQDDSLYWSVRVHSVIKSRVIRIGILEQGRQRREEQAVGILAAAIAEGLCEDYADTLDPSTIGRLAMEAYREVVAEQPAVCLGSELPRDADKAIIAKYASKGGVA